MGRTRHPGRSKLLLSGRNRKLTRAGVILAAVGLAVALYLAWAELRAGPGGAAAYLCQPGSGCDRVWSSPYASMLGLPLSVWGALAYLALLGLAVAALRKDGARWAMTGALVLSWAGAAFSLYLLALQLWVVRGICPWCSVSGVLMVSLATLHTLSWPYRKLPGAMLGAGLAAGVALAVINYVPASVLSPRQVPEAGEPGAAAQQKGAAAVASQSAGKAITLEELNRLLTVGSPSAPVLIEIYSDFQCPYCAAAAEQVVRPLLEGEVKEGKVRLGFRNYAFLGVESKWAAEAAACAALQGRFWEYHDLLFASQRGENVGSFTIARLVRMADELGLDTKAFGECLSERRMRSVIEASFEEGRQRGVRATPTFFVNGQRVEGLVSLEELRRLALLR